MFCVVIFRYYTNNSKSETIQSKDGLENLPPDQYPLMMAFGFLPFAFSPFGNITRWIGCNNIKVGLVSWSVINGVWWLCLVGLAVTRRHLDTYLTIEERSHLVFYEQFWSGSLLSLNLYRNESQLTNPFYRILLATLTFFLNENVPRDNYMMFCMDF